MLTVGGRALLTERSARGSILIDSLRHLSEGERFASEAQGKRVGNQANR